MKKPAEGTGVAIRKRSKLPGVMITQYVEELPPGMTTPDFTRKPIPLTIQEGKQALFTAIVNGDPVPEVSWGCNKGDISDTEKYITRFDQKNGEYILELPHVSSEQADTYKCLAINPFGRAVCTAALNVIEVGFKKRKPAPKNDPEDFRKMLKKKVVLRKEKPCKEGEIDPRFWEVLLSAHRKDYERICREYGVTDFRWMLRKLNQMKMEREAEQSKYVEKVDSMKQIEVKTDGTAKFELDMKLKDPSNKILLYKDGKMLDYGDGSDDSKRHNMKQFGQTYMFSIGDLVPEDAGLYQVDVEDANMFSTSLSLPDVHFESALKDTTVVQGQDAVFECSLSKPLPQITWCANDITVEHGEKYDITVSKNKHIHKLAVKNCKAEDTGVYSAIAGLKSSQGNLVVEEDNGHDQADEVDELARRLVEEQTRLQREKDEAERKAQEERDEAARRKAHSEKDEAEWKTQEERDEAARKAQAEKDEAAWKTQEEKDEAARKAQADQDEAARRKAQTENDEAARKAQAERDELARRKAQADQDEAARRKAKEERDEAARKKAQEERDEASRRKAQAEKDEAARRKAQAEKDEAAKRKAKEERDEEARKKAQEERDEAARKAQAEQDEAARRKAQEERDEAARRKAQEERDEAARRKAQKERDEAARKAQAEQDEAARRKAQEERDEAARRKAQAEKDEAVRKAQAEKDEAARKAKAERDEAARRKAQEEKDGAARRKAQEEKDGAARKAQAERDEAARRKAQEERDEVARRKAQEERDEAAKRKAQAERDEAARRKAQAERDEAARRKAQAERDEAARRKAQEEKDEAARKAQAERDEAARRKAQEEKDEAARKAQAEQDEAARRKSQAERDEAARRKAQAERDEAARRKAQEEKDEAARKAQAEQDEAARRKSQAERDEAARRKAQAERDEAARRKAQEERDEAAKRKAQAERDEAARRKAQAERDEAARRKAQEEKDEAARKAQAERDEAARRKAQEEKDEAARKAQAEQDEAARRKSQAERDEAARRKAQAERDEAARRKAQEEKDEAARKAQAERDEAARRKAQEEKDEAARKAQAERDEAARRKAQEEKDEAARKAQAERDEAARRKAQEEKDEAARKAQAEQDEAARRKSQAERDEAARRKAQEEKHEAGRKAQAEREEAARRKAQVKKDEAAMKAQAGKDEAARKAQAGKDEAARRAQAEKDEAARRVHEERDEAARKAKAERDEAEKKAKAERDEAEKKAKAERDEAARKAQEEVDEAARKVQAEQDAANRMAAMAARNGDANIGSSLGETGKDEKGDGDKKHKKRVGELVPDTILDHRVHFLSGLSNTAAKVGERAELSCKLSSEDSTAMWYKDGKELEPKDAITVVKDGAQHKLIINNCQDKDSGKYKFEAEGCKSEATLTIKDPPKIDTDALSKFSEPVNIKAGESASFKLPFSGKDPIRIQWFKDDEELREGHGVKIEKSSTYSHLRLAKCQRKDTGEIKVKIKNEFATVEASSKLIVFDKPTPPQGPVETVECTLSAIEFKWKPPKYDGGCKVTNYNLERQQVGRNTWTKIGDIPEQPTYRDTDVERGRKYCYKIRAKNSEGLSDNLTSEAIAAGSLAFPGSPAPPKIVSAFKGCINLAWLPPSNTGGGSIIGYNVEKRKKGSNIWSQVNPKDEPIREKKYAVKDIIEGAGYEFRVSVINTCGPGEPSWPSECVFARDPKKPPGQVKDLKITGSSYTNLSLSWTKPTEVKGVEDEAKGYFLEIRPTDQLDWSRCNTNAVIQTSFTIVGLKSMATYWVRVIATNEGGEGLPQGLDNYIIAMPPPVKPKFIDSKLKSFMVVKAGNTVHVRVSFEASPLPDITWLKDGFPVGKHGTITNFEKGSHLFIYTSEPCDTGIYTVTIKNVVGQDTFSIEIKVADDPKPPGPVELEQNVQGTVTITWAPSPDEKRDDRLHYLVMQRDSIKGTWGTIVDHLFNNKFTVINILPGREYNFRVFAKNDIGLSEPSVSSVWGTTKKKEKFTCDLPKSKTIDFQVAPKFIVPLKLHSAPPGYECYMSCAVIGNPTPHITWYHDNVSLNTNPNYYITNVCGVCSLLILMVGPKDMGEYKVVAESPLGQVECSTKLVVRE